MIFCLENFELQKVQTFITKMVKEWGKIKKKSGTQGARPVLAIIEQLSYLIS
jgi:hypothetical protein